MLNGSVWIGRKGGLVWGAKHGLVAEGSEEIGDILERYSENLLILYGRDPKVRQAVCSKNQSLSHLQGSDMSSSFWLDSDDEWDDDIYSSDDGSDKDDVKPTSRFADLDSDDDEEDDKRITRSAQEKSWDELHKSIKVIKIKMFNNDWNTVSTGAYIRCSWHISQTPPFFSSPARLLLPFSHRTAWQSVHTCVGHYCPYCNSISDGRGVGIA